HTILIGSSYLGSLEWTVRQKLCSLLLGIGVLTVLLIRSRSVWSVLRLEKIYTPPK
ncbi:sulfite exporter TauE/SafE family protein, partial [Leptolyngbya sp. FACHB-36]|nr:sulfite exporter TauE/SafE family protein [Leptolyngbya sp. FACHB-36]